MPGMVTTSSFPDLVRGESLKISRLTVESAPQRFFNRINRRLVPDGNKSYVRMLELEPPGYAKNVSEGGSPDQDSPSATPAAELHANRYGSILPISADFLADQQTSDILRVGENNGFVANSSYEELGHNPINDGFVANANKDNVCFDDLVYFTQNHQTADPGVTFDTENSAILDLSHENLIDEILQAQIDQTGSRGQVLNLFSGEVLLVVGRANARMAYEITQPRREPHTANFTRQFLDTFNIRVIIDPFVNGNTWVLLDQKHNPFVWVDKMSPSFSFYKVPRTKAAEHILFFRTVFGNKFPRGCRASTGG